MEKSSPLSLEFINLMAAVGKGPQHKLSINHNMVFKHMTKGGLTLDDMSCPQLNCALSKSVKKQLYTIVFPCIYTYHKQQELSELKQGMSMS